MLGGTGAIGKELVAQLVSSDAWREVVTIGRRPVTLPDGVVVKGQLEQRSAGDAGGGPCGS